jgi:hypothetical protein
MAKKDYPGESGGLPVVGGGFEIKSSATSVFRGCRLARRFVFSAEMMTFEFCEMISWRRVFWVVLGAGVLLATGGCEIIPLATLSTAFSIAGTVGSTGPEVYSSGKLDTAIRADADDCRRAVRLAATDLGLRIVRDRKLPGDRQQWDFKLVDDRQSVIEITVERRAPMLCWCQVNVGIFGSEPTAKLIMGTIESHLSPAATQPSSRLAGL